MPNATGRPLNITQRKNTALETMKLLDSVFLFRLLLECNCTISLMSHTHTKQDMLNRWKMKFSFLKTVGKHFFWDRFRDTHRFSFRLNGSFNGDSWRWSLTTFFDIKNKNKLQGANLFYTLHVLIIARQVVTDVVFNTAHRFENDLSLFGRSIL